LANSDSLRGYLPFKADLRTLTALLLRVNRIEVGSAKNRRAELSVGRRLTENVSINAVGLTPDARCSEME
jgi:hypothetical protein